MWHQWENSGLRVSQDILRDLDTRRAQCRDTCGPTALHGAALSQNFARWLGFRGKSCRADREALAPLAGGPKVDMHETRARIEAEPKEADSTRSRFEGDGIMV